VDWQNSVVLDQLKSLDFLRHSYATQYYKQTKDIETLRRILGHTDIGTTTIYITLANIDVEEGMKSFNGFL
jgi:site-specific recombinase XerD